MYPNDTESSGIDVVWLKKDVRWLDHAPLHQAAADGRRFILLFVYEPDILKHHSVHGSHVLFGNEGLQDMEHFIHQKLFPAATKCSFVTICHGEMTEVLSQIHRGKAGPILRILSHLETGHNVSYARDRRVKSFARRNEIEWLEFPQCGVIRGLKSRDGEGGDDSFSKQWTFFMSQPQHQCPNSAELQRIIPAEEVEIPTCVGLTSPIDLGLSFPEDRPLRDVRGGASKALKQLNSFLIERVQGYSSGISSPLSSWSSCSRLSPFLSFGHISLRMVFQALSQRQIEVRTLQKSRGGKRNATSSAISSASSESASSPSWLKNLANFGSRLRWRSHFMQKFESEVSMEFRCQCAAYEGLRTQAKDFNETFYRAFCEGMTGYPMVDACMRSLVATGWLNFRMRAMLASFASYNLWLDWRCFAPHLARCFLDYEPGIHYPQLQMQAGVTGINAMRVYSVEKQGRDQDPDGHFIRRWVKELENVPTKHIHAPWKMSNAEQLKAKVTIGSGDMIPGTSIAYPSPIVDEKATAKAAKEQLGAIRRCTETRRLASKVYEKHGSRRHTSDGARLEHNSEAAEGTSNNKRMRKTPVSSAPTGAQITTFFPSVSESAGSSQEPVQSTWCCAKCTFLNDKPHAPVCSMCGAERDQVDESPNRFLS